MQMGDVKPSNQQQTPKTMFCFGNFLVNIEISD
jgi:hypothetical protein